MVLGDHGRKLLRPLTPFQTFISFPWKRLYNHSIYFRQLSKIGVGVFLVWTYVGFKGEMKKLLF